MSRIRAAITGAIGGFTSGMTGIGGGTVMVPLLTGYLKMPQHRAHATSLVIVIFAALSAVSQYLMRDQIKWELAAALAVFLLVVGIRLLVWG